MAELLMKSNVEIEIHPFFWKSKVRINGQEMKNVIAITIHGDIYDDLGLIHITIEGMMLPEDDPIIVKGVLHPHA